MELLACHMLGDYITQTNDMAINKLTDKKVRIKHVTTYVAGFIPSLLLHPTSNKKKITFLATLWIGHFIIDSKRWASGEEWPPKPIMVDQSLHAIHLAALNSLFLERR